MQMSQMSHDCMVCRLVGSPWCVGSCVMLNKYAASMHDQPCLVLASISIMQQYELLVMIMIVIIIIRIVISNQPLAN